MNRHMREMDNMMNSMMGGMFGMNSGFMEPRQQSIMSANSNNMLMNPFGGFGGGNLFGSLMQNRVKTI